jgi:hypothetical protein
MMTIRHASTLVVLSALVLLAVSQTVSGAPKNYRTHLSGKSEVPPAATIAQGEAIFQLSSDSTMLTFKLNVANIEDVRAAHIHFAPEDVNGPVVVTLYGGPPIPGRTQGPLAEGTITAADLEGPLAGGSLAALITIIESGEAYVNVHTDLFPGGEIRGQVQ